jgi:bacillithiol biosynthesis deacetylase BshB1
MNHLDQIDILAFGAHPDDVELAAGGTVLKHVSLGKSVAIVDLTQGEMGTRGSKEDRIREAKESSKILGISNRENLNLGDCFFEESKVELIKVIEQVRRFKPNIVLCNAINDRHPDHGRAGALVSRACYLSGLPKIKTQWNEKSQESHRPVAVYHYIQDRWIDPDVIVDISDFFDDKLKAIKAFKSQFYDPLSTEPATPISGEDFLNSIKARAIGLGRYIHTTYGEGFTAERYIGVNDLTTLL